MTKGFVTKTGSKHHRGTCRFAKNATEQETKLGPCAVCKPHISLSMLPVKSVGKENLTGCKVCKASCADPVTREEAPKLGFVVTPTGKCYHTAACRLVKKSAVVAAPKAVKAIKPIKNRKAVDFVNASVMEALGQ